MSDRVDGVTKRPQAIALCVLAGVCIAGAVPPWGFWPLAFIGFAIFDHLLIGTTPRQRFGRAWLITASWLFPAMLWMFDLTAPGYIVASSLYAAYFGVAAALTPTQGPARFVVFPGLFTLGEIARWYWPFGGVPLANVALGQVESPLAITARLAGPAVIIAIVVMLGQALRSLVVERERSTRHVAIAIAIATIAIVGATLHPRSTLVRDVDVAVVQGGGPTRTRASSDQEPVVLARHIEATRQISTPVDLILWPENVVNPGRFLDFEEAQERVAQVAIDNDAVLLPGWFHPISDTATANYHTAVSPTGEVLDRYDKERIVPFGEYVPLRGFIEGTADVFGIDAFLPSRDLQVGMGEPVLDTPVGPIGVAISWEAYFSRRSREAAQNDAQLLTNPTNGSSFWLTQVHTQQVASNQLRAIENDRWLLMAGPTGLSAVIDPQGNVLQRTGIGERAVLIDTVEMRDGRTLASYVGPWPAIVYGLVALIASLVIPRTNTRRSTGSHRSMR